MINKTHPAHYVDNGVEVIDMMVACYGVDAVVDFCQLNAFKYRMRAGKKDGETIIDDIRKALYYEQKIKELNGH